MELSAEDKAEAGTSAAPVETVNVEIADGVIRNKPQEVFKEAKQAVDLTQAEVIRRGGPRYQRTKEYRPHAATSRCPRRRPCRIASYL